MDEEIDTEDPSSISTIQLIEYPLAATPKNLTQYVAREDPMAEEIEAINLDVHSDGE